MAGCCNSVTGRACMARSAKVSLLKYTYAFMPTANTMASSKMLLLWNSEPMNTIIADMPPSSSTVLSPLAWLGAAGMIILLVRSTGVTRCHSS
ncbi:Uncharacterised protein [Mycobacteroides abscessus subsp. abscessus]|nr:Uncharacterised protein [Mycobacteroides abscessus subsp. abscessus]